MVFSVSKLVSAGDVSSSGLISEALESGLSDLPAARVIDSTLAVKSIEALPDFLLLPRKTGTA